MTLLEMLNQVLLQSGFLERRTFTGQRADIDDKQMLAIANRVNKEIRDFYPWGELRKRSTFTIQDGITRYALPADFKSYLPDSIWEGDGSRQAEFPVPDGRWFRYKFSNWSDGCVRRIKKYGNEVEIENKVPGEELVFEYLSRNSVQAADMSLTNRFTDDTDKFVLDNQLFILGVQAHWAETKLLPQAQSWMANYMRKMNEAIGRDAGSRTIGGVKRGKSDRSPYYPLWQ